VTLTDSALTVHLTQLSREITAITDWSIDTAYLTSTDGFSFSALSSPGNVLHDLELQPCELEVHGVSQLIGRIDSSEVGGTGSLYSFQGRDYIADLVESNADPQVKIAANTQLGDALIMAMAPCGIDSITDFENVLTSQLRTGKTITRGGRRFRQRPLEEYKPKPGEGIYEFCNRLAARHGVTIQPGASRNEVVLDAPDYTQSPSYDLVRTDDPNSSRDNNVIRGSARRDFSSFPTYSVFTGTGGGVGETSKGLFKTFDIFELVAHVPSLLRVIERATISGRWTGSGATEAKRGALYRLLYHRDQEARVQEDVESALRRAVAERLKDTLAYTCTVKGHADARSGAIYSVNTMANVSDALCNVHEPLWVARRTFRFDSSSGATTELELWRPGSFIIDEGAYETVTQAPQPTGIKDASGRELTETELRKLSPEERAKFGRTQTEEEARQARILQNRRGG
jgi:prophage tail gpP-like protein